MRLISKEEYKLLLLTLLVGALLPPTLTAQKPNGNAQDSLAILLAHAYATLQTDKVGAVRLFEEIVERDSTELRARRQLGSLYISSNRYEEALKQFFAAQRLLPSDTTELQIAYILNTLGRNEEAYAAFSGLRYGGNATIREKARVASSVLSSQLCSDRFPWWGRVYAASYYESRFNDIISSASLYGGYYVVPSRTFSAYGLLSVNHDSRSTGGTLPVIFSDNYSLLGVGLRIRPLNNFFADLQTGVAYDLIEHNRENSTRADVRLVAVYGNGVFPDLASPEQVAFSLKPFADFYFSTGYYSRYKNAIGYYQARAGFRMLEWMYSSLDVYVRGDFIADTRREFYNNVAEGSIGLRLNAYQPWGVSILAEFHQGTYWAREVPVNRSYQTVRLFFIIDHTVCF